MDFMWVWPLQFCEQFFSSEWLSYSTYCQTGFQQCFVLLGNPIRAWLSPWTTRQPRKRISNLVKKARGVQIESCTQVHCSNYTASTTPQVQFLRWWSRSLLCWIAQEIEEYSAIWYKWYQPDDNIQSYTSHNTTYHTYNSITFTDKKKCLAGFYILTRKVLTLYITRPSFIQFGNFQTVM